MLTPSLPALPPTVMDGKELYTQMLRRMPPSANAKPPLEAWCLDTALEATPVGASQRWMAIELHRGTPV